LSARLLLFLQLINGDSVFLRARHVLSDWQLEQCNLPAQYLLSRCLDERLFNVHCWFVLRCGWFVRCQWFVHARLLLSGWLDGFNSRQLSGWLLLSDWCQQCHWQWSVQWWLLLSDELVELYCHPVSGHQVLSDCIAALANVSGWQLLPDDGSECQHVVPRWLLLLHGGLVGADCSVYDSRALQAARYGWYGVPGRFSVFVRRGLSSHGEDGDAVSDGLLGPRLQHARCVRTITSRTAAG
jgi:hypothetical protein